MSVAAIQRGVRQVYSEEEVATDGTLIMHKESGHVFNICYLDDFIEIRNNYGAPTVGIYFKGALLKKIPVWDKRKIDYYVTHLLDEGIGHYLPPPKRTK